MYDYKKDVIATRFGCLGSSDGRMIENVAKLGFVPKSAYERLAVVKGLIPQQDIPETDAIRFGNELEMQLFDHLHAKDERWQSNVRLESFKFSKPTCKLISHPDFLLQDREAEVLYVGECKAVKYGIEKTRKDYSSQLYVHYVVASEFAKELGSKWRVKLVLFHYNTEGLDLSMPQAFDPSRLTMREIRPSSVAFDIGTAMNIIETFLDDFNEYYRGEEIEISYLPKVARNEVANAAGMIRQIKRLESVLDKIKAEFYDFMLKKNIRSLFDDEVTITCVEPTETSSFDAKRYLADLRAKHPRKAKKIEGEYTRKSQRKGYCLIKVKDNEKEE